MQKQPSRKKAIALARLKAEDNKDMQECMDILLKNNSHFTEDDARIIAASIREYGIRKTAEEYGLGEDEVNELLPPPAPIEEAPSVDDALPLDDSVVNEMADEEEVSDPIEEDMTPEISMDDETNEEDLDDKATLQIEVSEDNILELQEAIDEALGTSEVSEVITVDGNDVTQDVMDELHADDDAVEFADEVEDDAVETVDDELEILDDNATNEVTNDSVLDTVQDAVDTVEDAVDVMEDENADLKDIENNLDIEDDVVANSNNEMDREAMIKQRKEARNQLVKQAQSNVRQAAEDIKPKKNINSTEGVSHADGAQLKKEHTLPVDTMDGSQGSELVTEANWSPDPIEIPTMNPENLELNKSFKATTPSGGGALAQESRLDFDVLQIPSEDGDKGEPIAIPQSNGSGFKNHRGQVLANNNAEAAEDKEGETVNIEVESEKTSEVTASAAFQQAIARIKTAYSCGAKLVIAGIMQPEELDQYAEMQFEDNVPVRQMKASTALMLRNKTAGNAERTASTNTEAKSNGGNPQFASGYGALIDMNPAESQNDLRTAIAGVWSTPSIDEFNNILNGEYQEENNNGY